MKTWGIIFLIETALLYPGQVGLIQLLVILVFLVIVCQQSLNMSLRLGEG